MIIRFLKAFYEFWKDFLIGDCPEVLVGVAVILGASLLIRDTVLLSAIGVPLAVVGLLAFSVSRGRKS